MSYPQVEFKDSKGISWLVEDDGTEEGLRNQQLLRENFPCQNVLKKPKILENWYGTLAKADTADEVLKQLCRCVSWGNTYDFKTLTVRDTLKSKLDTLIMNKDQEKVIILAIRALEKKGAVPKKLKAIIKMLDGDSDDED